MWRKVIIFVGALIVAYLVLQSKPVKNSVNGFIDTNHVNKYIESQNAKKANPYL